jgi:hypothetical protein
MPLDNKADFALGDESRDLCKYCVNDQGELLQYETILKNNAHYYKESQGITDHAALKMAKDLLITMPAWKNLGN